MSTSAKEGESSIYLTVSRKGGGASPRHGGLLYIIFRAKHTRTRGAGLRPAWLRSTWMPPTAIHYLHARSPVCAVHPPRERPRLHFDRIGTCCGSMDYHTPSHAAYTGLHSRLTRPRGYYLTFLSLAATIEYVGGVRVYKRYTVLHPAPLVIVYICTLSIYICTSPKFTNVTERVQLSHVADICNM